MGSGTEVAMTVSMPRIAVVLTAALLERPAIAADAASVVTRAARTSVALTVYNQDLALVKDTRTVALARGESTLRFEDVAARIEPSSVAVRSPTGPVTVVEQNYVFDLISPEKLMAKYVGQEVDLVETDEALKTQTTRATLLSTNGGYVYRIGDRIAVGHPGRVVLPKLPEELYSRPTLLWRIAAERATEYQLEVSYLTTGVSWEADYVLLLATDDSTGDLTAWVTLTNQSGARYDDATLKLVAGQINRAREPEIAAMASGAVFRAKPAPQFTEEGFFEYHLYTLDRRATVADNESKQMELLEARGIALTKKFLVVGQPAWFRSKTGDLGRNLPVGVFLEFKNAEKNHLGMPLPAGTVRVYKQDKSGAQQLVGEDRIRHTPRDETLTIKTGDAFDVVATRTQTDYKVLGTKPWDAEVAFEVQLRNHKSEAITVTLREPVGGDWKIVESSHPAIKVDSRTLGFEVAVPADGEATVRYRAQLAF